VIIIIMTNEKRQAKNLPWPPMTAFPLLAGCMQACRLIVGLGPVTKLLA
jgi:hypothetical protein